MALWHVLCFFSHGEECEACVTDPVRSPSRWEKFNLFVDEVCESLPLVSKEKAFAEGFSSDFPLGREFFNQTFSLPRRFGLAESFPSLVRVRGLDSEETEFSGLLSLREQELFRHAAGLVGVREYVRRSDFEDSVTRTLLGDGLNGCVKTDASEDNQDPAAARQTFIENLALNIADPATMDLFMAIMTGLLGQETDPAKWNRLYSDHFGWTEQELGDLDESVFVYETNLAQSIPGDPEVIDLIAKDRQVSGFLAGLLLNAESLYGNDDPDFVEEYREYVALTLNTLASEKKLKGIVNVQDHLKTPEDYRKTGFLNLPARPENALSGSQFMQDILGVDLEEFKTNTRQLGSLSKLDRENAIVEQIELGNIPDFLRRPRAIFLKGPKGEEVKAYVMPDYIAVGSNEDFVRLPLTPLMAQALERRYGLALPTKTIVEETYEQADRRVVGPSYTHPGEFEENSAYLDSAGFYLRSHRDIQNQLQGVEPGTLVSGGKKELVVSPFVSERYVGGQADESIAFYGLYDDNGIPIQRSPGHGGEAGYKHTEYALGIRFMSPMIVMKAADGVTTVMKMDDALKDPEVAKIISRVERTDSFPTLRANLMDGPFDAATVYRQKFPKGLNPPHGPVF